MPADIVAIRQLLSRYNLAGDRLRLDELAVTFHREGVLDTGRRVLRGRAEIIAGLGDVQSHDDTAPAVPLTFVRHHLTTSHIDLTGPDTATGRTYFQVYTDIGPDHAGIYVDRFRRVAADWLIEHRRVQIDWVAANALVYGARAAFEARRLARTSAGQRSDRRDAGPHLNQ